MTNRACKGLVVAAGLLLGAAACTDLTTLPKSDVTAGNAFNDPSSYRAFLAKIYGGLQVTGQNGPAGSGDIEGIDEGFSHYLRQLWQLQELTTDEAVIGWGDPGLPELNIHQWSTSNVFLEAMYYRIAIQVSWVNEFLRETTDEKLASRNVSPQLREEIQQYRAEARFLRALSYWHAVDLFGNVPLVDESFPIGTTPPPQNSRAEVYAFAVSELNGIVPELPAIGQGQYGRADQGAALMLLAKLYMNSAVYTGTARYAEARGALEQLLSSGQYGLDDEYMHLFLADNHTSPELIFAVPFDGANTRTFGGMTFLIHAAIGGNMTASDYGVDFGWWGLRARPQLYALYGAEDDRRSIFYTAGHTVQVNNIGDFFQGLPAPKYQNVTSTGVAGANAEFPDTDYPMFRLADAMLMYAEAHLRGGGGDAATALSYANAIRSRAFGDDSGNITQGELTLDFILDERARELFWEGHRRTDLIRFGRFAGGAYVWNFKGGTVGGQSIGAHLALFPIPQSEMDNNPNMQQNPGYAP